jgi:hypothetical protein
MTVLWPGLRGYKYSLAYAREWLPVISQNPAVPNILLFTASAHLETLLGPGSLSRKKIRLERLHHKGEAIRGVNDALHDPSHYHSGDLIRSILFLAMNEAREEDPPYPSPFVDPPLQNVR